MTKLLTAMYHDDPLSLGSGCSLENPRTVEESRIVNQLRTVNKEAAEALEDSIRTLADKQAEESFINGVRFGAQLMKELLEERL